MFSKPGRPRLSLRDAVLLTAPAVLLVGYLAAAALLDFRRAVQFDDFWAESVTVDQQFTARARALRALLPEQSLKRRIRLEGDDPDRIRIQVSPALLDHAYRDPQLNWAEWMEADLVEPGNRLLPVHLHKRGDNSVHWLTEKKTLTVRTRREEFYKRYRSFGLSAKDVLTSYVANRLAQEFDLLAPSTAVVPVVLNNQFAGMFRFIEVVDESFLRPFDQMPGNIFRGDAAERGEYFKGLPRDLFANPYIWDRVAVSERPTGPDSGQLRLLLEDLNGTDFAAHQRLMGRLDRAELARLLAYLLLVGDPYHMDGVHNQLWYEDPSTALLHPIPWDIRLLSLVSATKQPLNPFLRAALRDPWLVDGILAELHRRLADSGWVRLGDSLATSAWSRYHDEFAYDSLRGGLIPPLGNPGEVHRLLQENTGVLRDWLGDARVAYTGTSVLDFETRGYAGAELSGLEVGGGGSGARLSLRMDRNRNGVLDSEDPSLSGQWDAAAHRFTLSVPVPLLAAWSTERPGLAPGAQHYRFFLVGASGSTSVRPLVVNRYSHRPVQLEPWSPGSPIAASSSFSPWEYPLAPGRLHRLSGAVHLTADLRISASDTLVIDPGAVLRLDPDVSIISRGRVLALGTAARPIRLTRADPARPWGALALQGSGADSSRFSYVTFEWGGGALIDRIEYSGMVNVHRARGVVVEHSVFQDNLRSDDTFHALHAEITLRDSRFLRANSDAVDLDISSGLIANNGFDGSGGDAIDLMTSTPVIRGNLIQNSGDKGISIGEASRPLVYDNRIERCRRGIEVKDRSAPIVLNNRLAQNGVGIYEDRKNWRYGGGGWATVINTGLGDNNEPLQLDAYSRITISDDSVAGALRAAEARPLVSERFEEDFSSATGGWNSAGGVTQLEKADAALAAAVEGRPGAIGKRVDWEVQGGAATLVLETASQQLDSAEVVLVSPGGTLRRRLPRSDNPAVFSLTRIEVPAGRYTAIVIALTPRPRIEKRVRDPGWTELKPGHFWLRGFDLYRPARSPAS